MQYKSPKYFLSYMPSWIPKFTVEDNFFGVAVMNALLFIAVMFTKFDAPTAVILSLAFLAVLGVSTHWVHAKYLRAKPTDSYPPGAMRK